MYTTRRRSFRFIFVACCLCLFAGRSEAGLLDNGFVTLDVETGLEWLDMSYTGGALPTQFINGAHTVFPPTLVRQVPAGFRVASDAEARSLFAAVGLAPDIINSSAAYIAVDTLHTFLGFLKEVDQTVIGGNGLPSGTRYRWFQGVTGTRTPNPFDSQDNYISYVVRVDEKYFATQEFLGTLYTASAGAYGYAQDYGTFLVRSRANGTPATAIAPTSTGGNAQAFAGVSGDGIWFDIDPAGQPAVKITAEAPALITAVGLPGSFTDDDDLASVIDPTLGEILLGPGDIHVFSSPVSMFELSGLVTTVNAAPLTLDAGTAGTLPLLLQFDQSTAGFSATAVPEPASAALLVAVGALVARVRRG